MSIFGWIIALASLFLAALVAHAVLGAFLQTGYERKDKTHVG